MASPTNDPPSVRPGPDAMTSATPRNETSPPMSFAAVRTSDPAATARIETSTGVDAISSAESPAGTVVRPVVHRIWYRPKPIAPSPQIARKSRGGRAIEPSRQRRSSSSVADAMQNRRNVNPTGGRTATADLTTMKFAAHRTMTTRTPISASRRSAGEMSTPAARATGVRFVGSAASAGNHHSRSRLS